MNISNTVQFAQKPALYSAGTSVMWTDAHISKQLLDIHLNADLDLASRKTTTIEETVQWILGKTPTKELNILDLGCGPGLYCEQFAEKGHTVTGVDFSENSIDYAKAQAEEKELAIEYVRGNYCELDLGENKYDLIIQIFTDLGVLSPEERTTLLNSINRALKPGGILIFDIMADNAIESKLSPKEWEISEGGFWKATPYIHLGESFLFEGEKVILSQHIVIDEVGDCETYRFWTHYFSEDDIAEIVSNAGFNDVRTFTNVIPDSTFCEGKDVLFCTAVK